eukprot:NODE_51_length_4009_cov_4.165636.p1 GENE.NODE_51_length_4009_cov_4.165636~~NODE_51_length_4009_cov_4.165636.p1  ORF type:complete len:1228 (-),score=378.24 NODE_51_length_4009_cov_4.165636:326-3739(-)
MKAAIHAVRADLDSQLIASDNWRQRFTLELSEAMQSHALQLQSEAKIREECDEELSTHFRSVEERLHGHEKLLDSLQDGSDLERTKMLQERAEAAPERFRVLQQGLDNVRQELDTWRSTKDVAEQALKAQEVKLTTVECRLGAVHQEVQQSSTKLASFVPRLDECQGKLASLEAKLDFKLVEVRGESGGHRNRLTQIEEALGPHATKLADVEFTVSTLQRECKADTERIAGMGVQVGDLQNECMKLATLDATVVGLRSSLEGMSGRLSVVATQMTEMHHTQVERRVRPKHFNRDCEVVGLEQQAAGGDGNDNGDAADRLAVTPALQEQVNSHTEAIGLQQARLAEVSRLQSSHGDDLSELQHCVASLGKAQEILRTGLRDSENSIALSKLQIGEVQARHKLFAESVADAQRLTTCSSQLEKMEVQQAKVTLVEGAMAGLRSELQGHITGLRSELEEQSRNQSQLFSKSASLEGHRMELKQSAQEYQQTIAGLHKLQVGLAAQVLALEEFREGSATGLLVKEMEALRNDIERINSREHQRRPDEHPTTRSEFEALRSSLAHMGTVIAMMRRDTDALRMSMTTSSLESLRLAGAPLRANTAVPEALTSGALPRFSLLLPQDDALKGARQRQGQPHAQLQQLSPFLPTGSNDSIYSAPGLLPLRPSAPSAIDPLMLAGVSVGSSVSVEERIDEATAIERRKASGFASVEEKARAALKTEDRPIIKPPESPARLQGSSTIDSAGDAQTTSSLNASRSSTSPLRGGSVNAGLDSSPGANSTQSTIRGESLGSLMNAVNRAVRQLAAPKTNLPSSGAASRTGGSTHQNDTASSPEVCAVNPLPFVGGGALSQQRSPAGSSAARNVAGGFTPIVASMNHTGSDAGPSKAVGSRPASVVPSASGGRYAARSVAGSEGSVVQGGTVRGSVQDILTTYTADHAGQTSAVARRDALARLAGTVNRYIREEHSMEKPALSLSGSRSALPSRPPSDSGSSPWKNATPTPIWPSVHGPATLASTAHSSVSAAPFQVSSPRLAGSASPHLWPGSRPAVPVTSAQSSVAMQVRPPPRSSSLSPAESRLPAAGPRWSLPLTVNAGVQRCVLPRANAVSPAPGAYPAVMRVSTTVTAVAAPRAANQATVPSSLAL